MGRVLLTIIIPLLLPTALYVGWRLSIGRATNLPSVSLWLAVAGLVLASLTLALLNTDFTGPREGRYVPPHVSDGVVIPGHVEPGAAEPAPAR